MIFDWKFPAECREFLKKDPTLLKYTPEYTAYFFEPPLYVSFR